MIKLFNQKIQTPNGLKKKKTMCYPSDIIGQARKKRDIRNGSQSFDTAVRKNQEYFSPLKKKETLPFATRVNVEDLMLSEVRQTKRTTA